MKDVTSIEPNGIETPGKTWRAYNYKFVQVKDSRGNVIEGLTNRNGKFYYQTYVPGCPGGKRIALRNEQNDYVKDIPEARKAIQALKDQKKLGHMPLSGRTPKLKDYIVHYLATVKKDKDELTIKKETSNLKLWEAEIGELRLTQIRLQHLNDHVNKRLAGDPDNGVPGVGNETANHDVVALANLLNLARDEKWLQGQLVTETVKRLKVVKKKKVLVTNEMLDVIMREALLKKEDGQPKYLMGELFVDWLKFMACSGARRQAALSSRWSHVDWKQRQLHLYSKFDKHIIVDFNTHLEAHLKAMLAKRTPGCDFLFPGRFETIGKGHVNNMQKTIEAVRSAVGMPDFSPHDLRHQFISYCVMDGIDFMTIAKWVGHSDGGILIGNTYGHLSRDHEKRAAKKVTLGQAKEEAPAKSNPEMDALKAQLAAMTEMMKQLVPQAPKA